MKFLIRDYRESDFEHFEFCTNEIQKCIEAIDSWEMMELGNNYSKLTSNLYLDEIKTNKGLIKIAEADGKPVGTGLAIVTDGDPIIKNKYKKEYLRTGWIKNVFVDESCRGQGIGTALVTELENFLKLNGATSIRLQVFEPNIGARSLYETNGYTTHSREMIKKL